MKKLINYKYVKFCFLMCIVQGGEEESKKVAENKVIKTKVKLLYKPAQKWDSATKRSE